jgi:hypothetical protein
VVEAAVGVVAREPEAWPADAVMVPPDENSYSIAPEMT